MRNYFDASLPGKAAEGAGILGIGPVGQDRGLVSQQHLLQQVCFGMTGFGQFDLAHQAAALVHGEMGLVAKVASLPLGVRSASGAGLAWPFLGGRG
jgi:hypothetical protein